MDSLGPPLRKQSLQEMVYQRLREAIFSSTFLLGQQIKIGLIAQELNVSALPVREALRRLEAEGLVTFEKKKKIVVNQLSREDLFDIYSTMIPLEEISFEKCFSNLDNYKLKELERVYLKITQPDVLGQKWVSLNSSFHAKIHEMTGSPRLIKILSSLGDNVRPYFNLFAQDKKLVDQANREHGLILEALKNGSLEKGMNIIRVHFERGRASIDAILKHQVEIDHKRYFLREYFKHA